MGTFTEKLLLSDPDSGQCNWDTDWWRNTDIIDSVVYQLMAGDQVISGANFSNQTGLNIDIDATVVHVNDTEHSIPAGTITLPAATPGTPHFVYIYVDNIGVLQSTTVKPTDRYVLLMIADVDSVTILRSADLTMRAEDISETPFMVENDCINGTFQIWQRGITQTTSGYGADDRWHNSASVSTQSISQFPFSAGQTVVPGGPTFFSKNTFLSDNSSGCYVRKEQRILDVRKHAGKTVAVKFHGKSVDSLQLCVEGTQVFGDGGSSIITGIDPKTVQLSSNWEKHIVFLEIPSVAGKTIGDLSYTRLTFWFDAGSDHDLKTNALGNQSGTIDLSEVEIYIADKELPVRRRTAEEEFALCLSYYAYFEQLTVVNDNEARVANTNLFAQPMIQLPSVTTVPGGGSGGLWGAMNLGPDGKCHGIRQTNANTQSTSATITVDAEL